MNRLLILTTLSASMAIAPLQSSADINSPDAEGYLQRGIAMYDDNNFNGCIDQLLQIRNLNDLDSRAEDVLYYLAMATLHSGDDEALDLLKSFIDTYPQSPRIQDVTMTVGDYFFTRGSYGEALDYYGKVNIDALTADRFEDITYRKAYSSMMLGEYDRANALFGSLLGTPRYANAALFYQGYIAYSQRDYSRARDIFNRVDTSIEPGDGADYYLSQLDFLDGKYREALNRAERLLASNRLPQFNAELHRIAGESLYNLGQTGKAIPQLQKYVALEQSPRPSACYILGLSLYKQGDYEEAIEMLQKAAGDEDVTGQAAYLYLGKCYVKTGNRSAAMLAFDKASRLNFDPAVSEVAAYDYIVANMDGGRVPFASTVQMLENFLSRYPRSEYANEIRRNLAAAYLDDSDYANALRVLDAASNPSDELLTVKQKVLLQMGAADYRTGKTGEALECFKRACKITGGDPAILRQCRLWAANCLYDLGRYDEAADDYLAYLNSAPKSDPNRTVAYYNLGYNRMAQEKYADAFDDFSRVASASGIDAATRADALNRAADALYCQRRWNEAADYYSKAYSTYPQAGDYSLFQQAEMQGLQRDYNGRIKLLDRMLDEFPSSALAPDALLAKAESLTLTGNPLDAATIYRRVMTDYSSISQGRRAALMLAMNDLNRGNRQEAINQYKYVATNYPTSQEARVALDDLRNIYAADGNLPDYVAFVNSIPDMKKIDISELESTAFAAAEERFLDSGNVDRLLDYLTQFDNGANTPAALLYLAQDAADRDDYDAAEGFALRILGNYPDSNQAEQATLIKADAEMAMGKGEMAYESYHALADHASSPATLLEARMGMLTTAIELDRNNDAIEVADRILSSSAANTDIDQVKYYRALALDRAGRHNEAYTDWQQLAQDPSTLYGAKSAVMLIESLTANSRLDEAEIAANSFIDTGTPHNYWYARGFIAYSDLLRRQGKDFEADEYLKALRDNYPGTEADIFEMISSRLEK
ncbi:MAG: tetratricopeptide repeat protein [Bacteroides sp.]|nr:tetratricopeptide repeat protein [Bacteroides sp.]MCM1414229.1 tetratricopeptide repeat protein [Bacteroides sp.]MCM1472388.1 tetratricopeptide repeat protein [Bacteroides sp.]